jgi:hypothetical protein
MVFGNPLIHIVEMKQMWRMHAAAVDMHEDTICDLAEEWHGTYAPEGQRPGGGDDQYGWIRLPVHRSPRVPRQPWGSSLDPIAGGWI